MRNPQRLFPTALFAALAAFACGGETEQAADAARPVVVVPVSVAVVEERIEGSGELQAKERAELASEVDGVVTELAVD
ncbi:MAG: efflux RND transporter periplasmic adaptor subunit, partial [Myxococcota bacterium]